VTGAPSEFDLSGKVALVTGGSRGIGRETVRAFARAGADVMVVSRDIDSCRTLAEEVTRDTGRRAVPYACHMGRWADVDRLADAATGTFESVDVLVNNAGMSPLYDNVTDVTEELWRKVIDVNLSGPFRLTALLGTRMVEQGGGSIINVSSVIARSPSGDVLPYAAAKAGLNAITVGFAHALGPSVRVNAVVLGPFLTDIARHWDMERFERQARGFALERGGRPEEITGTMLYLASAASSFTTGSLLTVDGGWIHPPEDG
jgi:NAD(P)-dependent dehydrogenase (short-subunit alcohol dehydrogenase family)